MAVKLTYRDLNNQMLKNAIKKLGNHYPYREPKVRFSVEKLIRKWDQHIKIAQEAIAKDVKGYAELDEKGELKFDPKSPSGIVMKEDKTADWEKYLAEFDKTEFTIEIDPITREQLDTVSLSPVEMISLEPILATEEAETVATSIEAETTKIAAVK